MAKAQEGRPGLGPSGAVEVRVAHMPLGSDFGPEEGQALLEVLRQDRLTEGPQNAAFQTEFAQMCGVPHAFTMANCSVALILAISLSATDYIGHKYGPDSREIHDQILRLDRTLGRFLDSLYTLRDSSRVLIALTSDHGVAPLPSRLRETVY